MKGPASFHLSVTSEAKMIRSRRGSVDASTLDPSVVSTGGSEAPARRFSAGNRWRQHQYCCNMNESASILSII